MSVAKQLTRPASALGFAVVLLLSGCAAQKPLYDWGPYDEQVYEQLKGTGSPAEQIAALEAHRQKVLSSGRQLPPGYEAHLGMLYGQAGQDDRFAQGLSAEKAAFPEGAGFMDFLLSKFKKP